MDWNQIASNWQNAKASLKQKWTEITDEDLDRIDGKREMLTGVIQAKYAISRDEAESEVNEWENTAGLLNEAYSASTETAFPSDQAKYNTDYTGADAGEAIDKQGEEIDSSFGKDNVNTNPMPGGNKPNHDSAEHEEKSIDQT